MLVLYNWKKSRHKLSTPLTRLGDSLRTSEGWRLINESVGGFWSEDRTEIDKYWRISQKPNRSIRQHKGKVLRTFFAEHTTFVDVVNFCTFGGWRRYYQSLKVLWRCVGFLFKNKVNVRSRVRWNFDQGIGSSGTSEDGVERLMSTPACPPFSALSLRCCCCRLCCCFVA